MPRSQPKTDHASKEYREGWERVFGKKRSRKGATPRKKSTTKTEVKR